MSTEAVVATVAVSLLLGGASRPLVLGTLPGAVPRRPRRHVRRPSRLVRRSRGDELGEVLRLRTALAAGGSLLGAVRTLASAGGPWAAGADQVVRRVSAGTAMATALDGWAVDGPGQALVADALSIASATGASQSAALDAVAATLRDRRSLEREVRALSSQAMASAVVVVVAPVAFAVAVAVLDGRVRSFFLGSLAGVGCIVAGLALDLVGAWWMRSLIGRVR